MTTPTTDELAAILASDLTDAVVEIGRSPSDIASLAARLTPDHDLELLITFKDGSQIVLTSETLH